jgi:pyridoxal phosphate enzyme (YggS family)
MPVNKDQADAPISKGESNDQDGAADRLNTVLARIRETAEDCGRSPDDITLVAVSKTHHVDRIVPVIAAGHRVFGENRVQEAISKYPDLRAQYPDLKLHLIGPLQTNKSRDAVRLFDVIETLDRPKLAHNLAREMEKQGRRPICYVEVNTGEEPQKSGVLPNETDALVGLARDELGLPVEGLMCIPPADEEPAMHFALLRKIAERNGLPNLSMGMSADFGTAIRFGSTHVRIGTAIFGPRAKPAASAN